MAPTPISIQRKQLDELPSYCTDAIEEANRQMVEPVPYNHMVRLERYATQDIKRLVEEVWQWNCTLTPMMRPDDRSRVELIIKQIQNNEPHWPYVSYWTDNMEGLMAIEYYDPDDETDRSVANHGDGWHRLIAAVELNLPEVEFLFIEA